VNPGKLKESDVELGLWAWLMTTRVMVRSGVRAYTRIGLYSFTSWPRKPDVLEGNASHCHIIHRKLATVDSTRLKRLPTAARRLPLLHVTYALCKCSMELFTVGIFFKSSEKTSKRYAVRITKLIKQLHR
jgi:hypothetical protein